MQPPVCVTSSGSPVLTCSSAPPPPVRTSLLPSTDQSPVCFSQSEQRKRRRKEYKRVNFFKELEEDEGGRFVGQMAVSFRKRGGASEKEESLILQDHSQKKRRRKEEGGASKSGAISLYTRVNGFRWVGWEVMWWRHFLSMWIWKDVIGCLCISSSSQNPLLLLHTDGISHTYNQEPGVFPLLSGQWRSSDIIPQFSSNHTVFKLWLSHAPLSPAPMLHLSAAAVETVLNWMRGGAHWNPQHPLRDQTAPPSLSSDHWY